MTKQKIAFVETNSPNNRGEFTRKNNFEPLGLQSIAAIAVGRGYSVNIYQQDGQIEDSVFFDEVLKDSPDIIAAYTMAYNFNSSKDLAEEAKRQNSNINIVFGGPHVSSCPQSLEDLLRNGTIDFGIRGEGDYSFNNLADSIDNPDLDISGLVYLENGKLKINPHQNRIKNLDNLPFALRNTDILNKTKIGSIMYPNKANQISPATIAYSRGCPFSCSFCDSKNIWGSNVYWRSPKNVVDEMQELKEKYGTNTVFFSDLTFNANPDKVHELCDEISDRNLGIDWYVLARAATPDGSRALIGKDLLSHMKDAGCNKIGWGIESVIPEVQAKFNKRIPNELIKEIIQEGHELGILNKALLILGDTKYESPETVKRTIDLLKEITFDEVRTSFLTPFPGSPLYKEAKENGDLLTEDWSDFDTNKPILRCDNFTPEELIEARKKITSEYYQSKEHNDMISKKMKKFPELKPSYEEHIGFLKSIKYKSIYS